MQGVGARLALHACSATAMSALEPPVSAARRSDPIRACIQGVSQGTAKLTVKGMANASCSSGTAGFSSPGGSEEEAVTYSCMDWNR
jgi:hypothetical protein